MITYLNFVMGPWTAWGWFGRDGIYREAASSGKEWLRFGALMARMAMRNELREEMAAGPLSGLRP